MKTILITGGSGFIGSALCKFYLKKKYKIINFDVRNNSNLKFFTNYFYVDGDIQNKKDLKKVFKKYKIDYVIHLAYINGTERFYKIPVKILNIAAKGVINICELCSDFNVKKLAVASSSEVYHNPLKIPTNEKETLKIPDIFNPRFSYGGGKIFAEIYAQNFFYERKLKGLIIFRPHNIYSNEMGDYHVIPQFFKIINNQKKKSKIILKMQGTGKEIRSFMHIDDFVKAFDLVFFSNIKNGIFNIGNNDPVRIESLVKKISKLINKKIIIIRKKLQKGSPIFRLPDIKKIKKLGYVQKVKLDSGLKSFLLKLKI
jgi:nucleoside-diphosphate-sugar epimerase